MIFNNKLEIYIVVRVYIIFYYYYDNYYSKSLLYINTL